MPAPAAQTARTASFLTRVHPLIPAKRRRTDTGPIYGYNCALSHLIGKPRISNLVECWLRVRLQCDCFKPFFSAAKAVAVKGCSKYLLDPHLLFAMINDGSERGFLIWKGKESE